MGGGGVRKYHGLKRRLNFEEDAACFRIAVKNLECLMDGQKVLKQTIASVIREGGEAPKKIKA